MGTGYDHQTKDLATHRQVSYIEGEKFAKKNGFYFFEANVTSKSNWEIEQFVKLILNENNNQESSSAWGFSWLLSGFYNYNSDNKKEDNAHAKESEVTKRASINEVSSHESQYGKLCVVKHKDINDPLVAMIGIGSYNKPGLDKLDGVEIDYKNMLDLFGKNYNYSVFFRTKLNQDKSKSNRYYDFKTRWDTNEIRKFMDDARLECQIKKHDSLIFIVSCHGTKHNMILDSDGNKFALKRLFEYFNGNSCHYLIDKPKIFIIDCCRGNNVSQPAAADNDSKDDQKKTENEKIVLKQSDKSLNDLYFHCDSNFCFIFANTEGYATADGSKNGGFLIRNVKKVFNETKFVEKHNLDAIIKQIRKETKVETTIISQTFKELNMTQIVESRSTIEDNIFFKVRRNFSS